ncbi:NADPH:quinone reductase-like Zn-dependent oxidoreductase [Arthrobacter ginsengisoli]|uniref:NADPH:quinone reductase-like Zn-dependent oxidoreductase n=1 Tax=Arthrobacter ginsengisoli TaxID=1356565 RepID=A0ABU1U9D7_9MICC|nr:NAD(P)-dependent alcohol dehydrogenase [Arthrobacter ginsengisoli]MDR7081804.1 NADPH:quinone reductase-like Zn-dependent oxidoreductase [Arthrobacter ginsengisoli]
MKAIVQDVYGSADTLELRDVDTPVPGDDDVLIRVQAAGVEQGVWHLMSGLPYLTRAFFGLRAPKTPIRGREVAGRVEAAGRNVDGFRPGDEVFGTAEGSFAEFVCAKPDKIALKPVKAGFEQAAVVPISGTTALQGLRDSGRLRPGQDVLVIGAGGGVGSFAVQLAKALGARVTGVCSTAKVELVRSIGADHVIDYRRDDFADGARQFDLILDTAGNRPLSVLRRALKPRGTLVIVGGEGGNRWTGGFERSLRAALLSLFVSQKLTGLMARERQADLRFLAQLIDAGSVTPVIDKSYPLGEAPEAIRYMHAGSARGKVVVTV